VTSKKARMQLRYIKYTLENPCGIWLFVQVYKMLLFCGSYKKKVRLFIKWETCLENLDSI